MTGRDVIRDHPNKAPLDRSNTSSFNPLESGLYGDSKPQMKTWFKVIVR